MSKLRGGADVELHMFCWTVRVGHLQAAAAEEESKPSRTKTHHCAGTLQTGQPGSDPVHLLHLNTARQQDPVPEPESEPEPGLNLV